MAERKARTLTVLGIICLLLCLASGGMYVHWRLDYRESAEVYEQIREEAVAAESEDEETSVIDSDLLLEMNPDYVFWIEIPGTEISYPVVQTANNSDYLRKSFNGEYRVGGCIFMDAACPADLTGRNTVIYGHRMYDGTMFSGLKGYLDPGFAEEHAELWIHLGRERLTYTLFSVRRTDVWDNYSRMTFEKDEEYEEWLADQKKRSVYGSEIVSSVSANAVTLVTCAGDGSERLAVTWMQADSNEYE